jgi:hypothetical protein
MRISVDEICQENYEYWTEELEKAFAEENYQLQKEAAHRLLNYTGVSHEELWSAIWEAHTELGEYERADQAWERSKRRNHE